MEKYKIICLHCGAEHELTPDEDGKIKNSLIKAGKDLKDPDPNINDKKPTLSEILFGKSIDD